MPKLFSSGALAAILASAFPVGTFAQEPVGPYCGTVTTAPESRFYKAPSIDSAAFQASNILIYLDMDGAFVRSGFDSGDNYTSSIISGARNLPPPNLTAAQKAEIVRLVGDDFSPFNIRVTDSATEFFATPAFNKQLCIVTTFPGIAGFSSGTGGVSPFAGIGHRLPNAPTFAFSGVYGNQTAEVAMTISHELGHALGGLPHQHLYDSDCHNISEYHPGFGTGPISFDPIMGDGQGDLQNNGITNWFGQTCPEPVFGSPIFDFEFLNAQVAMRADDFPDYPAGDVLPSDGTVDGVLSHALDTDYLKINFKKPGTITVTSDNIDLKVSVLNAGGKVMDEYNDADSRDVVIPRVNGMRYLKIEAAGNENMSAQFMTGQYKVTY